MRPYPFGLIALVLVLGLIGPVKAQEERAPGPEAKADTSSPEVTAEDRQVIENIDLLELMQLLQDLEVVASLEEEE